MFARIALIAFAGSIGSVCRYAVQAFVDARGVSFPAGTFVVNMVGCLLFGVVWVLAQERGVIGPEMRIVLLSGFMGAFTTFSTLIFESGQLARGGAWPLFAANIGGQIVLGLALLGVGMMIGRTI